MPQAAAFSACEDPPFRLCQVDGKANIVGKKGKAGSFRNRHVFEHGYSLCATIVVV